MSENKNVFKVIHHFSARLVSNKCYVCVYKCRLMFINRKILGAKKFFPKRDMKKSSRFLGVIIGA